MCHVVIYAKMSRLVPRCNSDMTKKADLPSAFSSETGTRTLVSAVRGRRPRPIDDITMLFVVKQGLEPWFPP